MAKEKSNLIFLGCNYTSKKIKSHFDQLKFAWERDFPVTVCLIDRQPRKGARDLWREITTAIEESALAIFDVSGHRPNVVLELGYALCTKDPEQILVCFDESRRDGGPKKEFLLSDISHLNQIRYRILKQLDEKLYDNLEKVPTIKGYLEFKETAKLESGVASKKYIATALQLYKQVRDQGPMSDSQIGNAIRGTNIHVGRLTKWLKQHELMARDRGRTGKWYIVED